MKNNSNNMNKPSTGKGKNNRLTIILACIAGLLVILVAVLFLLIPNNKAPEETVPPTEAIVQTEIVTEPPIEEPTEPPVTEPVMLDYMAELYEQYPDVCGWLKIDGTNLDNAVVFTPEDYDFYLRKNLDGKYSTAGVPFVDASRCSIEPESDNLIIHGHNMYTNGTMFHCLLEYADEDFWKEHPTIQYSTLYEERTYEIIAAFYDRVYLQTEDVFKFYNFVDAETEEEWDEAIRNYREKALYDTGVDVKYGDRLLTLVTCSYHTEYGRFVVVARYSVPESEITVNGVG